MTMTMTMTMTMSNTMTMTTFPAGYWSPGVQVYLNLPKLFAMPWDQIELPPAPGPDETQEELRELLRKQRDRDERKWRRHDIEEEAHAPSPKFGRIMLFGPASHPHTFLLMQAMVEVGLIVVMHYKARFGRARPSQIEPELRPLIDVPGHPSYPSGHATQTHLIAQALSTVVRNLDIGRELFRIADEVSVNREWAGLHYASDTEAGKRLARGVFPYVQEAYRDTFGLAAREWL